LFLNIKATGTIYAQKDVKFPLIENHRKILTLPRDFLKNIENGVKSGDSAKDIDSLGI
jgi:hypothetical protein